MHKKKIQRKFMFTTLKLKNLQKGVVWIPPYKYRPKLIQYLTDNRQAAPIEIDTNISTKRDLAFVSSYIDQIIEDYLHSKQFHFDNIAVFHNPFRWAPKTAVLLMYSEANCIIQYKIVAADKHTCIYEDTSSLKQYHRLSVTGLEDGMNYIQLEMYNADMQLLRKRTIHIYLKNTSRNIPTLTRTEHMNKSAFSQILVTGGGSFPYIFQPNGNVMHFLRTNTSSYGILPLSQHTFLWPHHNMKAPSFANPHTCVLYEMDFMGRIRRTYHVKNGLHHFACLLPNGNIVSLSSSNQQHTEDLLVELDRSTGKIVREINVKELLGTHLMNMVDWAHPNCLDYNEKEDCMLITFRNVHCVLKFNWSTLEVLWILSPPALWKGTPLEDKLLKPSGTFHYSYQAHATYELTNFSHPENNYRFYMIFDNHRLYRRPIDGHAEDGYSYINIYGVNEKDKTVREFKHLKIDSSGIRSNAVYDHASNRIFNMSGCMSKDLDLNYRGKIEEYCYDSHQLINRWEVANDFFSAFPFKWNSDDYCKPLIQDKPPHYNCGEADSLSKYTGELPKLSDAPLKRECFSEPYIEESYLYFYTLDHSISSLILQGEKGVYQRDYTDTWQTHEIHKNHNYYCVVSLADLPDDHYKIKVLCGDRLYDTSYYINTKRK